MVKLDTGPPLSTRAPRPPFDCRQPVSVTRGSARQRFGRRSMKGPSWRWSWRLTQTSASAPRSDRSPKLSSTKFKDLPLADKRLFLRGPRTLQRQWLHGGGMFWQRNGVYDPLSLSSMLASSVPVFQPPQRAAASCLQQELTPNDVCRCNLNL